MIRSYFMRNWYFTVLALKSRNNKKFDVHEILKLKLISKCWVTIRSPTVNELKAKLEIKTILRSFSSLDYLLSPRGSEK